MTKRCTKGAKEKKGPKSTGYSHCPTWKDVVDKSLDEMRKLEQKTKSQNVKEKMEMAQRAGILTLKKGGWKISHLTANTWLRLMAHRHGACGWSVVQLDHYGEREPMHGYVGPRAH